MCHPLEGVTRGGPTIPRPAPSDATVDSQLNMTT